LEPGQILAPDIDETASPGEAPRPYARRMALGKLIPGDGFSIAADTVVAVGNRILPKAETVQQAQACLTLLAGRRHRVYTGVAVRAPDGRIAERVVATVVGFARLDAGQVKTYLDSGEWAQKAGGYAIQGRAAMFVDFLAGSYSGVVGLPLHETMALLRGLGWK